MANVKDKLVTVETAKVICENLAAPAGHGLGKSKGGFSLSDLNNIRTTGWYHISENGYVGDIDYITANYWYLRVDAFGDGTHHCTQTLYPVSAQRYILQRIYYNGNWSEWGIENPAMDVGVEYRTTERHNGNAVYVQRFDLGLLGDSAAINFEHGLGIGRTELVRFFAQLQHQEEYLYYPLPMVSSNGNVVATLRLTANAIEVLWFSENLANYKAYVTLWYTKA